MLNRLLTNNMTKTGAQNSHKFRNFYRLVSTITLSFCISTNSFAVSPSVTFFSDDVSDSFSQNWVAQNPNTISWLNYQIGKSPSEQQIQNLNRILEEAQKSFLNHDIANSNLIFKKIIQESNKADWEDEQRKVIAYAWLRYIEQNRNQKDLKQKELKKLAEFAYDVSPAKELFSPRLIEEFEKAKSRIEFKKLTVKSFKDLEKFQVLKIDGKPIFIKDTVVIKVPSGIHRFSVYANNSLSTVQVLKTEQFLKSDLKYKKLVSGTCEQPEITNSEALKTSKSNFIILSETCALECSDLKCQNLAQTKKIDLKPDFSDSKNIVFKPEQASNKNSKKWWWIAGAVIVAGITTAVVLNQNKSTDPTPSHKSE